jgi:hypothetical protein
MARGFSYEPIPPGPGKGTRFDFIGEGITRERDGEEEGGFAYEDAPCSMVVAQHWVAAASVRAVCTPRPPGALLDRRIPVTSGPANPVADLANPAAATTSHDADLFLGIPLNELTDDAVPVVDITMME